MYRRMGEQIDMKTQDEEEIRIVRSRRPDLLQPEDVEWGIDRELADQQDRVRLRQRRAPNSEAEGLADSRLAA